MLYVAHRLFAAHDRHVGALLASALSTAVGPSNVFLPFCDTDEENLQADVKGRRLFELDRERLSTLRAMIAVLHGPSLDDGVCMEIGYAAALDIPVVIITTDFQTYGLTEQGPVLAFPDPLVELVAAETIRVHRLGPDLNEMPNRFSAFASRNHNQMVRAIELAVRSALGHAREARPRTPRAPTAYRNIFCEPSPYQHHKTWESVVERLRHSAWRVHLATRLNIANNPLAAAAEDWAALRESDFLVVDVSGPETPPGGAVMIGAAAALGCRTIAVFPKPSWTFAAGREPNWRNLMIQYSVGARIDSPSVLRGLLDE